MKKLKTDNFTLIEMIAVVAIASMLIGIFIPAFNRMLFGSKVDQAASNFKLGLETAQSQAISSRKYVAMILPGVHTSNTTDDNGNSKDASKRLKAFVNGGYRLAFVRKDGNSFYFSGWVPGSSWRNAYDGAMLAAVVSDNEVRTKFPAEKDDDADPGNDEDPSLNYDLDRYFKVDNISEEIPNSNVCDRNKHFTEIKLDVILTSSNANSDYYDTDDIRGIGSDNLKGIVFSPYGGVMGDVTPLQFYFTEAKIANDRYEYPNLDNFVTLKLNSITAKVEYVGR